jgi:heme/copper-type cytochrome/quinol oxidase subunit 4
MRPARLLVPFAALIALTAFELVVIGLPVERAARVTALVGLATTKAAVILLGFMGLRDEPRVMRLTIVAPLLIAPAFAVVLMLESAFRARGG